MPIWFDHVFNINYNYPSIDSLDFMADQIREQLHQEEDSVQRRLGHLTCQEERQISLRSHTLDGAFVAIYQRLNNSESSATTTGYVER
jgi:hypothetical protein